jgi:hypothetical protein
VILKARSRLSALTAKSREPRGVAVRANCKAALRKRLSASGAARSLLLPFDQFAFAELDSADKEQKLRLVFATHEILISGHALRRIETAVQRLELSGIADLPSKFHPLIAEGQPRILKIVVTENKADGLQSPESLN